MMYSNVIVGITISSDSFVFSQSRVKVSASLTNVGSLTVGAFDLAELQKTVYRKPTHTDRLLDESSYNLTSHKATTIKTLKR